MAWRIGNFHRSTRRTDIVSKWKMAITTSKTKKVQDGLQSKIAAVRCGCVLCMGKFEQLYVLTLSHCPCCYGLLKQANDTIKNLVTSNLVSGSSSIEKAFAELAKRDREPLLKNLMSQVRNTYTQQPPGHRTPPSPIVVLFISAGGEQLDAARQVPDEQDGHTQRHEAGG